MIYRIALSNAPDLSVPANIADLALQFAQVVPQGDLYSWEYNGLVLRVHAADGYAEGLGSFGAVARMHKMVGTDVPRASGGAGGGGINIASGLTAPDSPSFGDIWVEDAEFVVGAATVSVDEPVDPQENDLWLKVYDGVSATLVDIPAGDVVARVSLSSLRRRVGSAWERQTAYAWDGSEWRRFGRAGIYSGSYDNTVRKISSSGTQVWSYTGHTSTVLAVAVDPSGNVYSGSSDKSVRKISSSGSQVWSYTGHTSYVRAVAVDSSGYVYSGSSDYTVRKISPSGSQVWSYTGHTSAVNAVAVDSSGYVYSGSSDKSVRKISPAGAQVWSYTGHTAAVWAVAVDPPGNVYSGSLDNTVRKISPSGSQVWSYTGHTSVVFAVAVDSSGNVYSGSDDKSVRKISSSGSHVWSYTGHTSAVLAVAVDLPGNVYSGSADKPVRKISPSGTHVWSYTGHTSSVSAVAVDPGCCGAFNDYWPE